MKLLILVASLALASGGVLQNDITADLTPPGTQDASFATAGLSGYQDSAAASAASASFSSSSSSASSSSDSAAGWVGIPQQGPTHLAIGVSGPQYQGSTLTTGANYQQQQQQGVHQGVQGAQVSGSGHKYTTVTFGNGLVGLGHSVDYNAIGQLTGSGNQNYQTGIAPQVVSQGQYASNAGANSNVNTVASAFDVGIGASSQTGFSATDGPGGFVFAGIPSSQNIQQNTVSYSHNTQQIPIEVPQPYPVTVTRPVPVPVAVPRPVEVPRPVPVEVLQPVPVVVERPYPVTVTRHVGVPVPKPVYVKVPHPVHVPVAQPYPVYITKPVHVKVPTKVEIPVHYPVKVHDHHHGHYDHHQAADYHHNQQHHHHHQNVYDAPHYHGYKHHSTSILSGLTGGLSSQLHGGHGHDFSHHHGNSFGTSGSYASDHKFANGLGLQNYHHHHHQDYKPQISSHGFSDSLNFGHGQGYAHSYTDKYIGGDYAKYANSYPSFSKDNHFPSKYADYSGSSYSGFGAGINSNSYKEIPATISQQYDSNGGYKY